MNSISSNEAFVSHEKFIFHLYTYTQKKKQNKCSYHFSQPNSIISEFGQSGGLEWVGSSGVLLKFIRGDTVRPVTSRKSDFRRESSKA